MRNVGVCGGWQQQACFFGNNFRCAASGRSDDVGAAGHGFNHGQSKGFIPLAGEEEDTGFVVEIGGELGAGDFAEEGDLAREDGGGGDFASDFRAVRGGVRIAGEEEAHVRAVLRGLGEEFERKVDAFFRLDASAESPSSPAIGRHGGEGEERGVYAVVDDHGFFEVRKIGGIFFQDVFADKGGTFDAGEIRGRGAVFGVVLADQGGSGHDEWGIREAFGLRGLPEFVAIRVFGGPVVGDPCDGVTRRGQRGKPLQGGEAAGVEE